MSTNADIITTFNNARRAEENQLSLIPNSLGNLSLLANWSALSADEKVLHLMNAQRSCRAGINYGSGPVLGLSFEGVEVALYAATSDLVEIQVSNLATGMYFVSIQSDDVRVFKLLVD